MGLMSAVTVVTNLGYQKYYRPDQLVSLIQHTSPGPVLIATTQTTAVQIADVMAIGWEFRQSQPASHSAGERSQQTDLPSSPTFLLAHQDRKRCQQKLCSHPSFGLYPE